MHSKWNRKWNAIFVAMATTLFFTGCEFLDTLEAVQNAKAPTLNHKETALVHSPSTAQLAAYYCPDLLGSTICTPALGAAPQKNALNFDFSIRFELNNPNTFPIPTLSMLLATTLFKGKQAEDAGALCVKFCDENDSTCQNQSAEQACASNGQEDIDSFEDFVDAASNHLINLATGKESLDDYRDYTASEMIPAGQSKELNLIFTFDVDKMLNIMETVVSNEVDDFVNGATEVEVDIPYSMRGTVWVNLPGGAERFGLPFGPIDDTWKIY